MTIIKSTLPSTQTQDCVITFLDDFYIEDTLWADCTIHMEDV
jgi:hypothetical protein